MKKRLRLILSIAILVFMLFPIVANGKNADSDKKVTKTEVGGKEPVLELTALAQQYGTPPDQYPDHWGPLEEYFNIDYKIDWVPSDAYNEKLQLILASGEIPDLIQVGDLSDPPVAQAIEANLFAPLDALLGDFSEYPNLGKLNPDAWAMSLVNDDHYLIPRTRGHYNMPVAQIRGDWLDDAGMDIPKTTDELADYFKAVKKMYPNVIPLTGFIHWNASAQAFGPGVVEPIFDENGGLVHYLLTEAYLDWLAWHRDLYEAGCMAEEYYLMTGSQTQEMFIAGQSASYNRNIYHWARLQNEIKAREPDGTVVPIISITGPEGRPAFDYDRGFWGGLVMSSKVESDKQKRILKFLDAACAPEFYNWIVYGTEGIHWNYNEYQEAELTAKGKEESNNSFYSAIIPATEIYQKVISPFATHDENVAMIERVQEIDEGNKAYSDFSIVPFKAIVSATWAKEWAKFQDEYDSKVVEFVTGKLSYDDFRAYQVELAADPGIKKGFVDLRKSFDELKFSPNNKYIGN